MVPLVLWLPDRDVGGGKTVLAASLEGRLWPEGC